jgi:hypothetical protein
VVVLQHCEGSIGEVAFVPFAKYVGRLVPPDEPFPDEDAMQKAREAKR